jgi:hypothetical protein
VSEFESVPPGTPQGGYFTTTLTPEQLDQVARDQEKRRADSYAHALSIHPATLAENRRVAAAAAEAKRKAEWPDPHRSLAEARTALGTAETEHQRRQDATARGADLVAGKRSALEAAQRERARVSQTMAADIAATIAAGDDVPDRIAVANYDQVQEAEGQLTAAMAAYDQLRAAETETGKNVERLRLYLGLCDQAARIEDADRLAAEVLELCDQVRERIARRRPMAETWIYLPGQPPKPLAITPRTVGALNCGVRAK